MSSRTQEENDGVKDHEGRGLETAQELDGNNERSERSAVERACVKIEQLSGP